MTVVIPPFYRGTSLPRSRHGLEKTNLGDPRLQRRLDSKGERHRGRRTAFARTFHPDLHDRIVIDTHNLDVPSIRSKSRTNLLVQDGFDPRQQLGAEIGTDRTRTLTR